FFKFLLIANLSMAATKSEMVSALTKTCEKSLKNKMAFDKSTKACNCFKKEMLKLSEKELQHLILADQGKEKLSSLPVDEGRLLENYKLEVSYKCLGEEAPNPEKKKK